MQAKETAPTRVMGGRQRVVGLPYTLPADMEEIDRLDFLHYMLRFAFQGNYAAPITNPGSILDVGAGTGRWAIEMAQAFPHARVIGLDVKPPAVVATDFFSVCKGYSGVAAAQGITTQELWDATLERAQADLNTTQYQCVTPFFIAYGQRP